MIGLDTFGPPNGSKAAETCLLRKPTVFEQVFEKMQKHMVFEHV